MRLFRLVRTPCKWLYCGLLWGDVGKSGATRRPALPLGIWQCTRAWQVFLGRFDHSIDAKGRMAMPARFRDRLSSGVVVTRGFDACLLVYPMAEWMPLAERVGRLSIGDPDVRVLRRLLFSDAVDLDLDKQGRILVPASLREYARIDREAVVAGMHSFIEIWNPDCWAEERHTLDQDGADIAQRLAELI